MKKLSPLLVTTLIILLAACGKPSEQPKPTELTGIEEQNAILATGRLTQLCGHESGLKVSDYPDPTQTQLLLKDFLSVLREKPDAEVSIPEPIDDRMTLRQLAASNAADWEDCLPDITSKIDRTLDQLPAVSVTKS